MLATNVLGTCAKRVLLGTALCLLLLPNTAQAKPAHVQATLFSEYAVVAPGDTFWVGLKLTMEENWHTYWKNPGDSGAPTRVAWTLPPGFEAGPLHWPFPARISTPPLVAFGYHDEVVLLTKIKILPSSQAQGTQQLAAQVHWLACAEVCVPGKTQLNLEVVVGDARQLAAKETLAAIKQAQLHLPVPPVDWDVQAFDQGATGLLRFQSEKFGVPSTAQIDFFPVDGTLLSARRPQVDRQQNRLEFTLPKVVGVAQPLTRIRGVAVNSHGWAGPGSAQALRLDLPAQPAEPPAPRWVLLDPPLSALLGGVLILYLVRRLYLVAKHQR